MMHRSLLGKLEILNKFWLCAWTSAVGGKTGICPSWKLGLRTKKF